MNKVEIWRGQKTLRFIYFRYKDSPYFLLLILSVCIFVGLLLIFQIIIPQIQNWFSIRGEEEAMRQKIEIIRDNISFMSGLDKELLERNRKLMIRALPSEKDFGGIIDAVVIAAVRSGVSIDDFDFNLGLVSSISAEKNKNAKTGYSTTKLSIYLFGDMDKIKDFITKIGEELPISRVESISMANGSADISLFFYSKPYEKPRISEDELIKPLSFKNSGVLSKLLKWEENYSSDENQAVSSSSAIPLF